LKNISYLCTRLLRETLTASKVLKKSFSKKNFRKIWRFEKLALPLQPISASKRKGLNKSSEALETAKQEYEFFEDIEQLRSFIHS
jgi:hypothetical protein